MRSHASQPGVPHRFLHRHLYCTCDLSLARIDISTRVFLSIAEDDENAFGSILVFKWVIDLLITCFLPSLRAFVIKIHQIRDTREKNNLNQVQRKGCNKRECNNARFLHFRACCHKENLGFHSVTLNNCNDIVTE